MNITSRICSSPSQCLVVLPKPSSLLTAMSFELCSGYRHNAYHEFLIALVGNADSIILHWCYLLPFLDKDYFNLWQGKDYWAVIDTVREHIRIN